MHMPKKSIKNTNRNSKHRSRQTIFPYFCNNLIVVISFAFFPPWMSFPSLSAISVYHSFLPCFFFVSLFLHSIYVIFGACLMLLLFYGFQQLKLWIVIDKVGEIPGIAIGCNFGGYQRHTE